MRDVSKAHRLAKAIRADSVWSTGCLVMNPAVPFGDHKMSGYGRESGLHLDQDRVTRCSVRPTSAAGLAGSCNAINPVGYIATARN
jgi:acyl-CoA reductase-like NAD-dependent aldehyde dehydrogenase